jgi:hypothetical protein
MEKTANDLEKLKASRTENKTVFREWNMKRQPLTYLAD